MASQTLLSRLLILAALPVCCRTAKFKRKQLLNQHSSPALDALIERGTDISHNILHFSIPFRHGDWTTNARNMIYFANFDTFFKKNNCFPKKIIHFSLYRPSPCPTPRSTCRTTTATSPAASCAPPCSAWTWPTRSRGPLTSRSIRAT